MAVSHDGSSHNPSHGSTLTIHLSTTQAINATASGNGRGAGDIASPTLRVLRLIRLLRLLKLGRIGKHSYCASQSRDGHILPSASHLNTKIAVLEHISLLAYHPFLVAISRLAPPPRLALSLSRRNLSSRLHAAPSRQARASRIATRILDRIERYVTISYTTRTLVFWTFFMLVLIHWFCCVWGLVGQGTQRTGETEALRLATFAAVDSTAATSSARALKSSIRRPLGEVGDDPSSLVDVSQIANCMPGVGSCLASCELQLLAAHLSQPLAYTMKQESWICR